MFFPTLLHEYLTLSAERVPDKEALICGEERWCYREVDELSEALACALIDMGLKRGDRVVILLDNSSESVISLYGVAKSGGVFVILDGTTKAKKLRYILDDSGASILISHVSKRDVVSAAIDGRGNPCLVVWVGDTSAIPAPLTSSSTPWEDVCRIGRGTAKAPRQRSGIIDIDLASLIYTSGSTGEPKGVICSHGNMVSAARSIIQYLGNTGSDIIISALPLSFDYGLYQVVMSFMFGGTIVLQKNFSYPMKFMEVLAREQATGLPIVPTMAALLLRMQDLKNGGLQSVRYITNTGAALPVDHIMKLRAIAPQAQMYSMYGLTECKRVSYLPPEELDRRPSSVGKPIPNSETYVIGADGKELPSGQVGELVVRGANVMQGYWNAPELTSMVFRPGRYPGERLLYTGDLFKKDADGFLYFVGRKDDLIKTHGERVSPKEVESVIVDLDGVEEVAVIGVPDDVLGQAIQAYIVITPGTSITEKDILRHCRDQLESRKVPKKVIFLKALPVMPNGKVDKKQLPQMGTW